MNNKRGIYLLFCFAFFLGCFFQYSRSDGFLHIYSLKNKCVSLAEKIGTDRSDLARERYLLIYDPTDIGSMYARYDMERILKEKKKDFLLLQHYRKVYPEDLEKCQGVILATGSLGKIAAMPELLQYMSDGGSIAVIQRLKEDDAPISADIRAGFGFSELGEDVIVNGLALHTDFMVGGKGFSFGKKDEYYTTTTLVRLSSDAKVHISSQDGQPLLWESSYGAGHSYVFHGAERDEKSNLGVRTAMLSHLGSETIYPVVASKVFYIDDFPAPIPEGTYERIYNELGVTTEDFYRNIWWPTMLEWGKKYDLKYTGLVIETYDANVHPPFAQNKSRTARDNLVIYGRELLASGGEMGLHGYNHQSLAPEGYNQVELGYNPWESKEDMVEAMKELRRYVKEVYPDYDFVSYVPPSNILSPEGHQAVKEAFPEMRIYASLLDGLPDKRCYYQDFMRNEDGTLEMPRTTSGYAPTETNMWEQISINNYIGIFTHFVHPDEIFYEESKDMSWGSMSTNFPLFLKEIQDRYPWLIADTASESGNRFENYLDSDYRVLREKDRMEVFSWNHHQVLRYIIRSNRAVESVEHGKIKLISPGAYLLETDAERAIIHWENS